jgi:hypothetical protein
MVSQTNSPKEAHEMLSTKIRTTIITLVAAGSFGSAAVVPVAAHAATKQGDLEAKGYTCVHASTNNTICTDKEGHEWYCEESTDECGQIKLTVVKTTNLAPVGLTAAPVVTTPPVVKVTPPATRVTLAQ